MEPLSVVSVAAVAGGRRSAVDDGPVWIAAVCRPLPSPIGASLKGPDTGAGPICRRGPEEGSNRPAGTRTAAPAANPSTSGAFMTPLKFRVSGAPLQFHVIIIVAAWEELI